MPEPATLGAEFARALAAKDFSRVLDLMHPEIDFRGLTPNRSWEASDADAVVSGVPREWFEESDEIEALGSGCPRSTWRGSCSTPSSRWI